jgi:hypothetical protein
MVGIEAPPLESPGQVLLLVDSVLAPSLTNEVSKFVADLVGDGWSVVKHNVARHNDVDWLANTNAIASIKSLVISNYNVPSANLKGLILVGHVAIPYSGTNAVDLHGPGSPLDHRGAWVADAYYADVEGNWDVSDVKNQDNVDFEASRNRPGDQKWDADFVPSSLSLFVGRIDFYGLNSFLPEFDELALLKRYFQKNRRYRHKLSPFPVADRGIVWGSFSGRLPSAVGNYGTYLRATRNASAFFGDVSGELAVGEVYLQGFRGRSHLWGFLAGPGLWDRIHDGQTQLVHTTSWLKSPTNESPAVFYMLLGSYFGDFNYFQDNFLRGTLATANHGLVSLYAGGTDWRLFRMGLGEAIGRGFVDSVTNTVLIPHRFSSIQGDPTLRLHTLTPPTGLLATTVTNGVQLTWTAGEAGCMYYVYRALGSPLTPFTRLTVSALSQTTYLDTSPQPGTNIYMVRGLKLTTSGSGSYTNISQGAFKVYF